MTGAGDTEADDADNTLPGEDVGGDGFGDDEVVPGWNDATGAAQPAEDAGRVADGAAGTGLEDEPEARRVVPARRRRSRKNDSGEDQAAA